MIYQSSNLKLFAIINPRERFTLLKHQILNLKYDILLSVVVNAVFLQLLNVLFSINVVNMLLNPN